MVRVHGGAYRGGMRIRDVPVTPCPLGVDYDDMTPEGPAVRRCGPCTERITDLSALGEDEARVHLAGGKSCVRYVHDVEGNVVFHPPSDAVILPASALVHANARVSM